MIRSALLLCVGLLAAMCFACAQTPGPAASFAGDGPRPKDTICTVDGSAFLSHVQYLPDGFDPSMHPTEAPTGATDLPDQYKSALEAAYLLAPAKFQIHLCGLTRIYVNGRNCSGFLGCSGNSWGYRAQSPGTGTYVAISASLWPIAPANYVYHSYETDLLNGVFGWNPNDPYAPRYTQANADADTFEMTVLAALAHEMGHVRWYQLNTATPGGNYNPNERLCGGAGKFFKGSWHGAVLKPPKWRQFLTRHERDNGNGAPDRHSAAGGPQVSDIDDYIYYGNMKDAAFLLDQLYQASKPWASYYAAVAPDEDFVETYKFYVLTNAKTPLTSLPILINGVIGWYQKDIPLDYGVVNPNTGLPDATNKPLLLSKVTCIRNSM